MTTLESQTETAPTENRPAVASLAHALSGPLNSLLAMGELLQRQPLTLSADGQLHAILDIGRRMARLISHTLDAENVNAPAQLVPTSLRDLVDDVESLWRSRMGEKAAQLLISCNAPTDMRLMLDPEGLRRLLDILIESAVADSTLGVVELHLSAHIQSDGFIAVEGRLDAPSDRGCASEAVTFDLCRALVQQMGGGFSRTDHPGSGFQTLFTFRAPEADRNLAGGTEDMLAEGPLPPRTHILIVDDNATNRIVAAALCEMFNCTSETAEDGLQALEAVQARPFDLILMDIKMPRMDGIEATKAIRALSTASAATPIVALTANADPASVAAYLASGMQAVVDKPIKPAQLLSTLQSVLCDPIDTPVLQAAVA